MVDGRDARCRDDHDIAAIADEKLSSPAPLADFTSVQLRTRTLARKDFVQSLNASESQLPKESLTRAHLCSGLDWACSAIVSLPASAQTS